MKSSGEPPVAPKPNAGAVWSPPEHGYCTGRSLRRNSPAIFVMFGPARGPPRARGFFSALALRFLELRVQKAPSHLTASAPIFGSRSRGHEHTSHPGLDGEFSEGLASLLFVGITATFGRSCSCFFSLLLVRGKGKNLNSRFFPLKPTRSDYL